METTLYAPTPPAAPPLPPPVLQATGNGPPTARSAATEDYVFLYEGGIVVTKTRFMASGQTFALANITFVQPIEIPASIGGPTVAVMAGVVVGLIGFADGVLTTPGSAMAVIGAAIAAAGIVSLIRRKPTYAIVLNTSGSETKICHSQDADFITRVVAALNEAIVARG